MVKTNQNIKKDTIFYPERCSFSVDTNNLINFQMIQTIIEKFDSNAIYRLNDIIKGIKFYVGGNQWHFKEKGVLRFSTCEFDFKNNMIYFYLSKIFESGFHNWRNQLYGSFKRYIWESFCHEVIMCLVDALRIDLSLVPKAKKRHLNIFRAPKDCLLFDLLNFNHEDLPKVNFISINQQLWTEELPKRLGFLDTFYNRKINVLKKKINTPHASNMDRMRIFNELRKIKLGYEYEYNLSELINYCIHNEHFESYFKVNWQMYGKLHREFYYKAKRIILKFFKVYEILDELKEYKDSANRTHYFLTHATFERVKSGCLQNCIQKIKNSYLEEYNRFKNFYRVCPICKQENINQLICEDFYFSTKYRYFKEVLLEKMNDDQTFDELNTGGFYFGIPCDECFEITKNIYGKYSDFTQVQNFIINYRTCPICLSKNHVSYLLSFYHDDNRRELRNYLINNKDLNKLDNYKINIGIPCCRCYEEIFEEKPNHVYIDPLF